MTSPVFKGTMEEANEALGKAKVAIMAQPNCVFYSTCMLSQKHIWDNSQPTAYTDGVVIGYNVNFFMACSHLERAGLLLHETLHVAFSHIFRGEAFPDHHKFNRAADYVINLIVVEAGFKIPKGGLYDKKYKGMFTEQIYGKLKDQPPPPGFMSDLRDPAGDPAEMKEKIDDMLVQAVMQSRHQGDEPGSIPGDLEVYVDKLLNPEVPWFRLLKHYMTKFGRGDYSLRKVNRRFMPQWILPTLYSPKVCDIAIGEDVSMSVTKEQHDHFVSETAAILKGLKPEKIHFVPFDTTLKKITVLKNLGDLKRLKFKARGGTDIEPLMQWALKTKPVCLIVFTDGYYEVPKTNPRIPVLWVVNNNPNFVAPFGKHIPYNFKDAR